MTQVLLTSLGDRGLEKRYSYKTAGLWGEQVLEALPYELTDRFLIPKGAFRDQCDLVW